MGLMKVLYRPIACFSLQAVISAAAVMPGYFKSHLRFLCNMFWSNEVLPFDNILRPHWHIHVLSQSLFSCVQSNAIKTENKMAQTTERDFKCLRGIENSNYARPRHYKINARFAAKLLPTNCFKPMMLTADWLFFSSDPNFS